ncbi:MAG: CaiB/BaiF CoA transferase family protein [Gammaproteobacteria bacterium]
MSEPICSGLTVVELGAGSAPGSIAGMMLADNGARVLKIEPPQGDRLRAADPSAFLVWNRGKESVIADLRTDAGRREVREIIAAADVVIEAFGAGRAQAWGLDYEALRGANPGLVYCSVKGFGSTGPYAHLRAYEGIVAAKAGVFSLGNFGIAPTPMFTGGLFASVGAAHMAVCGIAAALRVRGITGRGQRVEAAMVQGVTPINYYGLMEWQLHARPELLEKVRTARSPREGGIVATRIMMIVCTGDGRWIQTTMMLPHQAQALVRAAGLAHTISDPRFKDAPYFGSAQDAQDWEDLLWERFREQPWSHWREALLREADISFELIGSDVDGLDHPQFIHNGEVVTLDDPKRGPVRQVGPVAFFDETPARLERSAPALGEHGALPARAAPKPSGAAAPRHPLEGVTIVEFGYFYAMPYGLSMATALGARVIKIEPKNGDPMRWSYGPPEYTGCKTMEGKESLAIDLSTPQGQAVIHRIVEKADAFVCGFRPGVAERLNLGRDTLARLNPRLVYFHGSGYGVSGDYAYRPIYASEAMALAGGHHRHSGYWLDPALTQGMSIPELQAVILPRLRSLTPGDAFAALSLCTGLTLALLHQQRTGRGQFATRSMIGANAFGYSDSFVDYAGKPPVRVPDADQLGFNALYRVYQAAADWVFLAVMTQGEWARLIQALPGDLGRDQRFATAALRGEHDAALADALAAVFAQRPAAQWEALCTPAGVACVKVFMVSDPENMSGMAGMSEFSYNDPVLRETGFIVDVEHPIFGRISRTGPPATFSETPPRIEAGSRIGQHTDAILAEFGYSPAEIAGLRSAEVVFGA